MAYKMCQLGHGKGWGKKEEKEVERKWVRIKREYVEINKQSVKLSYKC